MQNKMRKYPSVWHTFERTIDGKQREFWVQDLPENYMESSLEAFADYFIRDEPMCRSLKLKENEKSAKVLLDLWRKIMKEKSSLACFTRLENGQEKLVAVNYCFKSSIHVTPKKFDDELVDQIFGTIDFLNTLKDPSKDIGVEEYLSALGLLTLPDYRGYNIGAEVLKSREKLCAALGLKASITVFTSPASQRLAEKVGFQDLVSATYDDLEKLNPKLKFPYINEYSKCIRNMYILYQ